MRTLVQILIYSTTPFPSSLFYEHHETIDRNRYIETTLVGGDSGTAIPHILATINGGVTIKYFLPSGIGDGQQVLLDNVTVSESSIVKAGDNNDFLISAPPLEGDHSIGIRQVEDVNVLAADRAQSTTKTY